jgi:hypothetical protein
VLDHREIAALRQLVERVTAVDPARQEFVARVQRLTTFIQVLIGAGS